MELLIVSIEWLKEGSHYELALEIYSILGIVYKFSRDYDKLVTSLNGYKDTAVLLLSESSTRVVPKYFRVAFYGPKTGELAGKAFIYKVFFVDCFIEIFQIQNSFILSLSLLLSYVSRFRWRPPRHSSL